MRDIKNNNRKCSKLTIKTQEQRQWRYYGVFTANSKHVTQPAPAPQLPTLSG